LFCFSVPFFLCLFLSQQENIVESLYIEKRKQENLWVVSQEVLFESREVNLLAYHPGVRE